MVQRENLEFNCLSWTFGLGTKQECNLRKLFFLSNLVSSSAKGDKRGYVKVKVRVCYIVNIWSIAAVFHT